MQGKNKGGRDRTPLNKITAKRMKALRESRKEKQAVIARVLNCSIPTVARYEKGKRGVPSDCLARLAQHWGVCIPYLTGETDKLTYLEYLTEIDEAENVGMSVYESERRAEIIKKENFFALCGFKYENLETIGTYEFYGLLHPNQPTPHHRVSSLSDPTINAEYTDYELEEIMQRIESLVELECYRKKKAPCNDIQDASTSK